MCAPRTWLDLSVDQARAIANIAASPYLVQPLADAGTGMHSRAARVHVIFRAGQRFARWKAATR
jgi:hypothetical protein